MYYPVRLRRKTFMIRTRKVRVRIRLCSMVWSTVEGDVGGYVGYVVAVVDGGQAGRRVHFLCHCAFASICAASCTPGHRLHCSITLLSLTRSLTDTSAFLGPALNNAAHTHSFHVFISCLTLRTHRFVCNNLSRSLDWILCHNDQ